MGLIANDLSRAVFLVFFGEDAEGADSGGGGRELGDVTMCLFKNIK